MAFTYNGNLSNSLEFVRFLIGDKDEEVALFTDEELGYFINQYAEPTENDLKKVALKFLKLMLNETLHGPSRERSGGYEVYAASAASLKLAVNQLEKEIRSSNLATPSFGGVYKAEVKRNRENDAYTDSKFYDTRIFGDDVWERP
jgi:hypothetical protein